MMSIENCVSYFNNNNEKMRVKTFIHNLGNSVHQVNNFSDYEINKTVWYNCAINIELNTVNDVINAAIDSITLQIRNQRKLIEKYDKNENKSIVNGLQELIGYWEEAIIVLENYN